MGGVARAKKPATTGDMIRSLAVIMLPLLLITWVFTDGPKDRPVTVVDYQPALAAARSQAEFPVLAPTNLPDGWRAVRATWVPQGRPYLNGEASPRNLWELGMLTPEDVYIGLHQGDLQPQRLVDQKSRDGRPDGESTVNGEVWQRLVSDDDRTRSLVRATDAATTVVVGDLPYPALEAYAATLSTSG